MRFTRKCDRCGLRHDEDYGADIKVRGDDDVARFELCECCAQDLEEWLEKPPRDYPEEAA